MNPSTITITFFTGMLIGFAIGYNIRKKADKNKD